MSMDLIPVSQRSSFDLLPQAHELATAIAKTEFVPTGLRNRPEAVMACVLAGHEIGIGPMQSLQKIHIIEGKPAMAAELMRALILADGHELWFEEKSATKVVACGQRRGSERITRVTWTMDDAQRAGLSGKHNYRKIPRQMLTARATAELARDIFADVIGGMPSIEELEDGLILEEPGEATDKPKTTRRRAPASSRKAMPSNGSVPASSPPPLPPLPGEETTPAVEVDEVVDAEIVEDEPAYNAADIGKTSQAVFANEYTAAPRGHKTKVVDRLRHAAIHAVTHGRTHSSNDLQPDELGKVMAMFNQIQVGIITYTADPLDDAAGVTFKLPSGRETTVMWIDLEAEPAAVTALFPEGEEPFE